MEGYYDLEEGLHFTLDKGNGEWYSFGVEELSKVQEVLNKASYNRGSLASATLYANGETVAANRYDTAPFTGGTVYLGKDALGSVRDISNDYGLLEDCYEYDAFGKPYKGDLSSGMNLGYIGKPYDTATGMYNYGYRDYQPETARFTTVDPIRDGANWFAYVNNDPVNWVDLWGLACISASDKDFLARTIYGEARGENEQTKEAVGWTIRNRADEKDRSIEEVVTQPYQYSAWSPSDPNYAAVTDPEKHSSGNPIDRQAWEDSLRIAENILNAPKANDPTQGATHYYDDSISAPSWTDPAVEPSVKEVKIDGVSEHMHFYNGVRYAIPKQ
jgi:RHS repeat-associated protein